VDDDQQLEVAAPIDRGVGSSVDSFADSFADRPPVAVGSALRASARCAAATAALLARRQTHLPRSLVGRRLRFADGTTSWIYRETMVDREEVREPCLLVVGFRLRYVRGVGHRLFRWESLLNTVLFLGYPGLGRKLWLAADERGTYRGIYDWDGAHRADRYARSLWWALALVCPPRSIRYVVVPGHDRDQLLAGAVPATPVDGDGWWRIVT